MKIYNKYINMEIYLPIAEIPVNILIILSIGFIGGILSGVFGIGGGFIATPLLIFAGIAPTVAVATSACQIVASSFSAFMSHLKRGNVDFKIGGLFIIGGFFGSSVGVYIFRMLKNYGHIDIVISLCYIVVLGCIGFFMAIESFSTSFLSAKKNNNSKLSKLKSKFFGKLPYKIYFPKSDITISIFVPIIASFIAGILVSIMGIGGGFIVIPTLVYIIGVPASIVIGTSLFQVIFVTSNVTILHSVTTQSVDILLALILLLASVIGAQIGFRVNSIIQAEKLRFLLALIMLAVVLKLVLGFVLEPANPFVTEIVFN